MAAIHPSKLNAWFAVAFAATACILTLYASDMMTKTNESNIDHLRSSSSRRKLFSLLPFHDPATVEMKGETCTYVNNGGVTVSAEPSIRPATVAEQVASTDLFKQLHQDVHTNRPIWTSGVVEELDKIVASGMSISCPHYPHSAEDLALTLKTYGFPLDKIKVGVISSISPWVEHVLKSEGASHVITVDYNPPIVCSGIDWIESNSVPQFSNEAGTYDLLVSFSGIEHSGLGRYGDPINPDGDLEAIAQIHRALVPGGFLLLGVPTTSRTIVAGNAHRIYGPDRLGQMLERFNMLGRVWNGQVFGGWDDIDSVPKLFSDREEIIRNGDIAGTWQFQNWLVLQKTRNS